MSREDWIILRLLFAARHTELRNYRDFTKAVLHLADRYGLKVLFECIDALRAERQR